MADRNHDEHTAQSRRLAIRDAGFAFARNLGDDDFRTMLRMNGSKNEQDVVIALQDELAYDVFERLERKTTPPAIIAVQMDSEPSGFGIIMIEPIHTRGSKTGPPADSFPLGRDATIGMVFTWAKAEDQEVRIPDTWLAVTHAA